MTINFYRMLVLAVMTLLMACNATPTAFAKNPMDCLILESSDFEATKLKNICEVPLNVKIVYEEGWPHDGLILPIWESVVIPLGNNGEGRRWAACFVGDPISGLDDYHDTIPHSCIARSR